MLRAIPPPNANLPTPSPPPKSSQHPPSKRQKELEYQLRRKQRIIQTLSEQNSHLQQQIQQLKQAKQISEQKIIQLSSQLYEAEHRTPNQSLNQTFDMISAVTIQKERPSMVRNSLDGFVGVLLNENDHQWQENNQPNHEHFNEEKETRSNPLRLSLPVGGDRPGTFAFQDQAIQQMHLMRRKTERMMEIQEGRRTARSSLHPHSSTPQPCLERPRRRFQRIR